MPSEIKFFEGISYVKTNCNFMLKVKREERIII